MKIGVFDSGVGALPVINAIKHAIPEAEIIYKDDAGHVPYGDRPIEQIHEFVKPIFKSFVKERCKVIVIACNTVTTNLISHLRKEFSLPLVGMEPAIRPAAQASNSKIIAVFATPRTLSSERYQWLKSRYAKGMHVLEPDCSKWAKMIENNRIDRDKIAKTVERVCRQGADQIVLGCTHYHWIEDVIHHAAAGHAEVIQPTEPVVKELKKALKQLA